MEKTRVKLGNRYWWINTRHGITVCTDIDWRKDFSTENFNNGNYFKTEEQAEVAAKKISEILKQPAKDNISIPTADDAKLLTTVANENEEERVKDMLDEVYKHILSYAAEKMKNLKPNQTSLVIPSFEKDFKGWEQVPEDDYASRPIPSMRPAWARAAEKFKEYGYTVNVYEERNGWGTEQLRLKIDWK